MKNIVLSIMVVALLLAGGIGGTFATWSYSETSADNYIETGSLDLRVNGADDAPWGTGVPTKVQVQCMIPEKLYGPFEVELWNAGQDCMPNATAYLHIKDVCCANVPPKTGSGYADPWTGDLKPEPELVAEYGGKVDCTTVPGIGNATGDDCTLPEFIYMWVTDEAENVIAQGYMDEVVDFELLLGDLQPCNAITIYFWFTLIQPSEEYFGIDVIPDSGDPGYDEMKWEKFNDWTSAALMKDRTGFNMEFDLVLWDP